MTFSNSERHVDNSIDQSAYERASQLLAYSPFALEWSCFFLLYLNYNYFYAVFRSFPMLFVAELCNIDAVLWATLKILCVTSYIPVRRCFWLQFDCTTSLRSSKTWSFRVPTTQRRKCRNRAQVSFWKPFIALEKIWIYFVVYPSLF